MDKILHKDTVDFLKWIDLEENDNYWTKNEKGEKDHLTKESWKKAMNKWRTKQLIDNKLVFSHVELRGG